MDKESYMKKGKHFYKRFEEEYPVASKLGGKFQERINEVWEKIGTFYGDADGGSFGFDSDGKVHGTVSFWFTASMLAEVIVNSIAEHSMNTKEFNEFKKELLNEAKKTATKTAEGIAIKSINIQADMSPMECGECGHFNPAGSKYCNECGKEL